MGAFQRAKTRLTYYDLFKKITEVWNLEETAKRLKIVTTEWRLKPNFEENILESLLLLNHDLIAR